MSDEQIPNDENLPNDTEPADSETSPTDKAAPSPAPDAKPKKPRIELGPPVFGKYRHFIVVIPFIVYLSGMMIGGYIEQLRESILTDKIHDHSENDNRLETKTLEEGVAEQLERDPDAKYLWIFKLVESSYPYTYMTVVGITTVLVLLFGWGYFKIPFRLSIWGFLVGAVGVFVWVGLSILDKNTLNLGGFSPQREAFNPFEQLAGDKSFMYQFLTVRLWGMIVIVPLIEEFFIRGFLMRYVDDPDWDLVPIGVARFGGLIAPTIYGLVAHPMEPLAAVAWFSMVTYLYRKTNNIWDCVVAHAVTNGLLAWYVIQYEQWHLW